MIHGPCGEYNPILPCMVKGDNGCIQCSKQFPKVCRETTKVHENGYPFYRQCENGRTYPIPDRNFPGFRYIVGNQWVISHNPYLSRHFQTHINVEFCASVKAIKYIHKYVYKGSDQTPVALELRKNEIAQHLHGLFIGPTEAVWRLFKFPTHEKFSPVQTLAMYLPVEQIVYYNPGLTETEVKERMEQTCSTLMAFFDYNANHVDRHQWLYQEFPTHYVYDKSNRQ